MTDDYSPTQEEEDHGGGGGFLNFLPAILLQRKWLIIVPTVLLTLAGVLAALLLPTTYRSTATLLVESQELPADLVGSSANVLIDQRIAKIRQQVLSRGDLISVIQQYDLYADQRRKRPLSQIIEKMRDNTTVSPVAGIGQVPNGQTNTIAFSMSYDYTDPVKAQLVMQNFVERFLELDAAQMAQQAGNTVDFLTDQANSIQRQIADLEDKITGLKTTNGTVLAGTNLQVTSSGGYNSQIAALQRENILLQQQAHPQSTADPVVAKAEANLAAAKALYTDDHPDVKLAIRQLKAAKEIAASQASDGGSQAAAAQAMLAANNAQIASLSRARTEEQAHNSALLSEQARAPVVMEQVSQLEGRADALRTQYRDVSERLFHARSSARMENEQKGERLSVIDPPVVPDKPLSPNRPVLIAGGIGAGLGLGIVLALIVEFFLRPIRGVVPIERMLGVPPLVVIPTLPMGKHIETRVMRLRRNFSKLWPFKRRRPAEAVSAE